MVKVFTCRKDEFVNRTRNKKVYCFGVGKAFERFCNEFKEVPISGIIDNYHYLDKKPVERNGERYFIMAIEAAVGELSENSILVITSPAFEDIIEQLDGVEELEGLECYIEMSLDDYQGVDETERGVWTRIITELAERKKPNEKNMSFILSNHSDKARRFQVWDYLFTERINGNKARVDIRNIAGDMGYRTVKIHRSRGNKNDLVGKCSRLQVEREWQEFYDMLPLNSFVLLQHPFPSEQPERNRMLLKMKEKKGVRFIAVVHDVEQLRVVYNSAYRFAEYEFMMQIADVLIVHNKKMKKYFVEQGISENRLVELQIFDYLYTEVLTEKKFDNSIIVAGNLGFEKSPYISKLGELAPINIHLYGPNFDRNLLIKDSKNVIYHGFFPSEELPQNLERGFGLVWDGESLDTCSGATGNYLRYNNPHKLSLYLASGLPVVVWAESAEAEFVGKNGLGLTVHSLYELNDALKNIDITEYKRYLRSVSQVSKGIRSGHYMKQAIMQAETVIGYER